MNAFAAAMQALLADQHLGTDALFRAGGTGEPVPVRVLRSAPDQVASAFGTAVLQATDVLTVATADLAAPAEGDTLTLGPELLTVLHAERDATGTAWRIPCRR